MSARDPDPSFWRDRTVLITGHTGFKGSWLARWLAGMGADVHGIALDPPTRPSMFKAADVRSVLSSDRRVDVRDEAAVNAAGDSVAPSIFRHLAAQPRGREC